MTSPEIRCLYIGFDGPDVAFQGCLPKAHLDTLETARETATKEMQPALVRLGDLPGHVGETGAKGGFRYRFDTGEDGEIWFFKHDARPDQWNIRVSVRSLALMLHGYRAIRDRLQDRLHRMGATVQTASVGRADIAADFLIPGFALDPALFVTHSHTSREAIADGDDGFQSVHYTGRRPSSVTIGKMPGRQFILYDKRKEAIQKNKPHWFDQWGLNRKTLKQPVWRIEFRAGKTHLKERWRITSFADLEATLADMVTAAFLQVRYLAPDDRDENISRRRAHPVWTAAQTAILDLLRRDGMTESGVVPGKVITGKRSVVKQTYINLLNGLTASFAAAHGLEASDARAIVDRIAAEMLSEATRSAERFRKKVAKAKDRMILLEDEHRAA